MEKLEGSKYATAYAENYTIEARSDLAKHRIKLRNFDTEVTITITASIGHQLKKIMIWFVF